jgi:hypothetical protein
MKIKKEDLGELMEILAQADAFKPIARAILDVLKSLGEEIKEIPEAFVDYLVQRRIKSIAQYESAGFSRGEAIVMTLDDVKDLLKLEKKFGDMAKDKT